MSVRVNVALGAAVVATLAAAVPASSVVTWTKVGSGATSGISGAAPSSSGWVVVRDNKAAGQNRIALVDDALRVTPLTWPGTQPLDLEALDAVPGSTTQYVAVTSGGRASVITISGSSVQVQRTVAVPRAAANVEAFAMARSGTTTFAAWANRGSTTKPGKVFAATFDPSTGAFGRVSTAQVSVPFPAVAVRQIADLKIVASRLLITSTSDPGANGPFDSAVYDVGRVALSGSRVTLATSSPATVATYPGHKVEALACGGDAALLGTDDENLGGSLALDTIC